MKKTVLLALILLSGCDRGINFTTSCTEDGEVYDTAFLPGQTGSSTGYNFSDGSFSTHDITMSPSYSVVFKCQHGKFVISGDRGEALYKKLWRGQHVTIIYDTRWTTDPARGGGWVTNFVGMHFVDAVPKPEVLEK